MASANIVGYSTKDYKETGFVATASSFLSVGENGCYLSQIKPNVTGKCNGTIQIQLLNGNGVMTKTYKFYQGGRAPYATDGWYLEKDLITAENDVLFEAGTGLWMSGIEGASFTTSGEVLEGDLVVPLQNGFKMVANPYPTTITLTKIQPIVTGKCNGAIQIQLLNKNGVMTKTYKYYQGGRAPYATDGWYEEKTLITEANDISFEGGTGLWMSGVTDSSVKFVCPITK